MSNSDGILPTGEVHPVANLFPMLPDDELQELAEHIRVNGLQQPIVLDRDGVLIDGRNRWVACQLISVKPHFGVLPEGADPVAFILGANVNRRNLNAGQRAMATAIARDFSEKKLQGKSAIAESAGISNARLSYAIAVREHAPELADEVLAGTLPLNDAYAEARQRKQLAEVRDEQAAEAKRNLDKLRKNAPDLAELVETEKMPLREALAAWREREQSEYERRQRHTESFANSVAGLWTVMAKEPEQMAETWLPAANPKSGMRNFDFLWTADGIRRVAGALDALANALDERGGTF